MTSFGSFRTKSAAASAARSLPFAAVPVRSTQAVRDPATFTDDDRSRPHERAVVKRTKRWALQRI